MSKYGLLISACFLFASSTVSAGQPLGTTQCTKLYCMKLTESGWVMVNEVPNEPAEYPSKQIGCHAGKGLGHREIADEAAALLLGDRKELKQYMFAAASSGCIHRL